MRHVSRPDVYQIIIIIYYNLACYRQAEAAAVDKYNKSKLKLYNIIVNKLRKETISEMIWCV